VIAFESRQLAFKVRRSLLELRSRLIPSTAPVLDCLIVAHCRIVVRLSRVAMFRRSSVHGRSASGIRSRFAST
jgi:hypothetical protein